MEMLFTAMKTSRKLGATTVAPSRLDRLRPASSSAQRGERHYYSQLQAEACRINATVLLAQKEG